MALTTDVKEELTEVSVPTTGEVTAEVSALLRYSATMRLVSGKIIIESEVDSAATAHRVIDFVKTLFGQEADLQVIGAGNPKRTPRYTIKWSTGGIEIARRTGLIDRAGRPVRGLPRMIIGGSKEVCVAAWRGAFLAKGMLTEPGRSSALEVATPSNEAALALVGAARRFGVTAKTKETRGVHRVIVKDVDSITTLLTSMGAPLAYETWEERRKRREVRSSSNRLANFDDANLRRSARAAVASAARVGRAFELLGDDIPEHLADAGRLRMKHRQSSLEELGQAATPPMTKDAVAGRIRRLLSMADKRAKDLGLPDTHSAVTEELFKEIE